MDINIFLPDTIKVGFQKREDTYTKKLAYVIYYDKKGILRKEKSWESWRDKSIKAKEFNNEPTSGFVLNKKAGGYSTGWNHRQTYTRVYDPRGFEFEITIENLLFILDNYPCLPGKGLEGEFVYGWSGTELVLLPVESEDFKNIKKFNDEIINGETVRTKDLKIGATYKNKNNKKFIYIGYLLWCDCHSKACLGKEHIFKEKSCAVYVPFTSTVINNNKFVLQEDKLIDESELLKDLKESKVRYKGFYFDEGKYEYKKLEYNKFRTMILSKLNTKKSFNSKTSYRDDKFDIFYKNKDKYNIFDYELNVLTKKIDYYHFEYDKTKLRFVDIEFYSNDTDFEEKLKLSFEKQPLYQFETKQ